MRPLDSRKGMVLIFTLWVLGILAILAVSVAVGIRQKISLIARLDQRSREHYLLEAAVKKAAGYIHQQMATTSFEWTPAVKMNLLRNSSELSNIRLGRDQAWVAYLPVDGDNASVLWGVVDEESKLNLNKVTLPVLTHVLVDVLSLKAEDADKLAQALLDWRQYGEGEVTGFFSDDYYSNLQYPYPKKSAVYENLDEILLVKGVTRAMADRLLNFVTIYGEGAVNINTASKEVLEALGVPPALADKILIARRGKDGLEATADDYVFSKTFEIAADVNTLVPLTVDEAHVIDALNAQGLLGTHSFYFTLEAMGTLASRRISKSVRAVYAAREDKIIYWKER